MSLHERDIAREVWREYDRRQEEKQDAPCANWEPAPWTGLALRGITFGTVTLAVNWTQKPEEIARDLRTLAALCDAIAGPAPAK